MPASEPRAPYVTVADIAGWLGINYYDLAQRISRSRKLGLPPPEPAAVRPRGPGVVRFYPNTVAHQGEWTHWSRSYDQLRAATGVRPRAHDYNARYLRRLWQHNDVERWLEDFASVITELIRCGDPAARLLQTPSREPTGRLRAIDPTLNLVTAGYVANLRAWARSYAVRLRAVDAMLQDNAPRWPQRWEQMLADYLGDNPVAVLTRCASWKDKTD